MRIVLPLAAIVVVGQLSAADPEYNVEQLVKKALAARQGIQNYHIRARYTYNETDRGGKSEEEQVTLNEVWRSGDSVRSELRMLVNRSYSFDNGRRLMLCRNCDRPGYATKLIEWPKGVSPVQYFKIDDEFDREDRQRIDWASLGMRPGALGIYHRKSATESLDYILRYYAYDSTKLRLTKDLAGDRTIEYDVLPKGFTSCTISPSKGFNPVRFFSTSEIDTTSLETETLVEYQQESQTAIWYPKQITTRSKLNGRHRDDQLLTIELVEFNRPIDPAVFTLAGMNLREGTPIEVPEIPRIENQPTWHEGKVDTKRTRGVQTAEGYRQLMNAPAPEPVPDAPPSWLSRTWAFLLAAFLGVVGLLALRKTFRRR